MTTLSAPVRSTKTLLLVLAALLLGVFLAVASPAQPAAAACGGTTFVSNQTELNLAITDFNAVTTSPCVFTIQLSGDIDLSNSTEVINNATSGVSLVIEGDRFAVDGQGNAYVRPFEISANTTVTMNELIVIGGKVVNEFGGGIFNDGTLTINDSEIRENEAQGLASSGGGIFNSGELTLVRTIVSDNDANSYYGGGIYNNPDAGDFTVIDSTISGNSADLA